MITLPTGASEVMGWPPDAIVDFHGEHYWLDNMWLVEIRWNKRLTFKSVEHGFVYFKTREKVLRDAVLAEPDPYTVKAMGRTPGVMREDWEEIRFGIMNELVRMKFFRHDDLRKKLLNTGDVKLIEGNTWDDNIWGDCVCPHCRDIPGQNLLGEILMQLRTDLRKI